MNTHTVTTEYGDVVVHLSGRTPDEAPGLLLLHANPGDHRDFDPIVGTLGGSWAIAAIDWPGYGESTVTDPNKITADALADVAAQVTESLAQNGFDTFTVIANSIGGYAAVRLAQQSPHRVRGLVLVQSAGFAPLNLLTRTMFRLMSNPVLGRRLIVPNARLYLGSLRPGTRPIFERARAVAADPTRLAVYLNLWRTLDDPRLDLPAEAPVLPDLPVQVVWGRNDPSNPWRVSGPGVTRALSHARISLLSARHEPFAEVPEEFLDAVREFLTTRAEMHP